jgi:hypothetical protein
VIALLLALAAGQPPERLSATGLYADIATRTIAADVLPFTPQYPLWTDGATKQRWIRLPEGSAIDARDPDAWVFPIGTRLWKQFSFGREVETRMLERGADGRWNYASYAWGEDGSDALLAPERGRKNACQTQAGKFHDIPGRMDCRACHEAGPNRVLGFSALQLSPDRDPLALHAEVPAPGSVDLAALLERGLVRGLPAEFARSAPRIPARTPRSATCSPTAATATTRAASSPRWACTSTAGCWAASRRSPRCARAPSSCSSAWPRASR